MDEDLDRINAKVVNRNGILSVASWVVTDRQAKHSDIIKACDLICKMEGHYIADAKKNPIADMSNEEISAEIKRLSDELSIT